MRISYLGQQSGDDVQRGLMDGLVLQWRSQGHVHQRSDFLQHDIPATRVVQDLAVLVDLFLQETRYLDKLSLKGLLRWQENL